MYRGRFAPSPTGPLHLGGAATAIFAAARARAARGELVLRMEDLDPPRVVPGAAEALEVDLSWLGLDFSAGPTGGGPSRPYRQSERLELYDAALGLLCRRGLTFLCDCSRADIARAASAPHAGEEGPRYPGTCRALGMADRAFKRAPAVRLAVPPGPVSYADAVQGEVRADVSADTGDFVLRRGDGVFSYQLAVAVDDVTMGITEVVRGADLRSSAPRQALLARLLGAEPPSYLHVPLAVGADGERLAKRTRPISIAELRSRGASPAAVLAYVARAYGQVPPPEAGDPFEAIATVLDPARFPVTDVVLDPARIDEMIPGRGDAR